MTKEEMKARLIGAIGGGSLAIGILEFNIPGYLSDIHPVLVGQRLVYGLIAVGVVLIFVDIKMHLAIWKRKRDLEPEKNQ
jgi:hypothetical protein